MEGHHYRAVFLAAVPAVAFCGSAFALDGLNGARLNNFAMNGAGLINGTSSNSPAVVDLNSLSWCAQRSDNDQSLKVWNARICRRGRYIRLRRCGRDRFANRVQSKRGRAPTRIPELLTPDRATVRERPISVAQCSRKILQQDSDVLLLNNSIR
jgi:hypothetical protein